jgi:hypothetical protein
MKIKIILVTLVFLVAGCSMNHPIIEEMVNANTAASSQKNSTHVERHAATALVVQKYFPIGMKKKEALALLSELKANGFEVLELNYMGTRIWPNKEFRNYSNVNREKHYPRGTTGYVGRKIFDRRYIILTFEAIISIKLDEKGVVVESKGSVAGTGP